MITPTAGDAKGPVSRPPFRVQMATRPRIPRSADDRLRRAVLARLLAEPSVTAAHIRVTACSGRVSLSGYVTSNAQKDAACAAARRVPGVDQLSDGLQVAVPCPDFDPSLPGAAAWG